MFEQRKSFQQVIITEVVFQEHKNTCFALLPFLQHANSPATSQQTFLQYKILNFPKKGERKTNSRRQPDVLQTPVEGNHLRRQKVELPKKNIVKSFEKYLNIIWETYLVDLELFPLLILPVLGDLDCGPHLTRGGPGLPGNRRGWVPRVKLVRRVRRPLALKIN